jgi:DNA-directed RNA polymerase subunit beta
VSAVIQAFFGSSQLSQFMDQTNPLAELTHKRRLSALGPGGLTRERAGFESRATCTNRSTAACAPSRTPEGPNIGLITSLASYARVNDLGFVRDAVPYREERQGASTTSPGSTPTVKRTRSSRRPTRGSPTTASSSTISYSAVRQGDVPLRAADRIDYMDVAPEQLVSIAAALIPFLEHDDANPRVDGLEHAAAGCPLLNPARRSSARGSSARWP